jgi:hypothetical protein
MVGKEQDILVGKEISIFYDDGAGHVSRKDGRCTSNSDTEIILEDKIILPKQRIVRVEVR